MSRNLDRPSRNLPKPRSSRRLGPSAGHLTAALGLGLWAACGGAGPASETSGTPGDPTDPVFETERVADGVYATPVRDGISPSQFASSVIIIRDDHVVVIDSRQTPTAARRLIATVAELTPLPVRYLINTHWHGDHVQGNAAFLDAFPGLEIVAGATAAEDITTLGRQRLDDQIARVRKRLTAGREMLSSGADPEGEPLDPEALTRLPDQIRQLDEYLHEREGLVLVPPDIEVADVLDLGTGAPAIRIHRVGPAHTRGDVVVEIPSLGILALGDLIEDGFPWFGDGYPAGWAAALDRIAELGATTLIPAHGPVLRDSEMFETQRRFVRALVEEARLAVKRGENAEEALPAADFSAFEAHFTRHLAEASAEERGGRYRTFIEETFERAVEEAARRREATRPREIPEP